MKPVVRTAEDGVCHFWCPGCHSYHGVWTNPANRNDLTGALWKWNGDKIKPTFEPSILVRLELWEPPATGENPNPGPQRRVDHICHSFVRNGQIQFLGDCTHDLAGKTVRIPADDEVRHDAATMRFIYTPPII